MNVCRFADLVVVVKRHTSSFVSILKFLKSILVQYVLVLALFLEKLLVILLGLVLNTSIAHWSC